MLALNLIVRAVILHEGRLLVNLIDDGTRAPFHIFFGGHLRSGETMLGSIQREVREEIGLEVVPRRLLYVVENFFFRGASKLHELGYYFLCELSQPPRGDLLESLTIAADELVHPVLLEPGQLAAAEFQPSLLKVALLPDIAAGFTRCPRAIVVNELPGDVDIDSGVYPL